jgi:hypothetical protein
MGLGSKATVLIVFEDDSDAERLVDTVGQYANEIGDAMRNTLFSFAGMDFTVKGEIEGWAPPL